MISTRQDTAPAPDAVVLGGGAIGIAVTYSLLRAGADVVSVFPTSGDRVAASRAAGAMLGAFGEITADDAGPQRIEFELRLEAQRQYPEWLREIADRSGRTVHQAWGTFIVANNEGVRDRASIRRIEQEAGRVGEPAEWVDAEDVPGLKPSPHQAPHLCLHLPNEHSVDSEQLLDALRACAATFAGWTHLDDAAVAARRESSAWTVTTKGGREVRAQHLVLSAGSRSFELLDPDLREEAGLPEMYFGKGVSCVVRGGPPIRQTIRTPNRAFACGVHVLPRAGDHLYVGATNCLGVDHDLERGVQPGELHNLFDEVIHQINTDIRQSRIEEIREGYRAIVADQRPVVGATGVPGLSVATGTYRNGVLIAPLVAEIVAREITGNESVENPFEVARESEGADLALLSDIGIRDIISFLHEPRGALPYDRAHELRKYVMALFQMAILDDPRYADLRTEIRQRLEDAPFNETMHKLFYEIVDHADRAQVDRVSPR